MRSKTKKRSRSTTNPKKHSSKKPKDLIFNYCDRWCERCHHTHECTLFQREEKRRKEHLAKGEDPDDMEIVMKDVGEELRRMMELIRKDAKGRGIDLDKIPDDYVSPPKPGGFPLSKKANRFYKETSEFLEVFREDLKGEFEKIQKYGNDVQELSWYFTLMPAKIYRTLCGRWEAERQKDSFLKGLDKEDAAKTLVIVKKCIWYCNKTLKHILIGERQYSNKIGPILMLLGEVELGVEKLERQLKEV